MRAPVLSISTCSRVLPPRGSPPTRCLLFRFCGWTETRAAGSDETMPGRHDRPAIPRRAPGRAARTGRAPPAFCVPPGPPASGRARPAGVIHIGAALQIPVAPPPRAARHPPRHRVRAFRLRVASIRVDAHAAGPKPYRPALAVEAHHEPAERIRPDIEPEPIREFVVSPLPVLKMHKRSTRRRVGGGFVVGSNASPLAGRYAGNRDSMIELGQRHIVSVNAVTFSPVVSPGYNLRIFRQIFMNPRRPYFGSFLTIVLC